jgi:CRISPR-associated endoribonuclease Cas6
MLLSLRLPEEKYARYLAPDFPDYGEMVIKNLTEKWKVFTRRPPPEIDKVTFSLLSPARKKGILIKAGTNMESKLIGYIFSFAISGPPELLRLGYYTGFGEKNSMGFGCTETRQ